MFHLCLEFVLDIGYRREREDIVNSVSNSSFCLNLELEFELVLTIVFTFIFLFNIPLTQYFIPVPDYHPVVNTSSNSSSRSKQKLELDTKFTKVY